MITANSTLHHMNPRRRLLVFNFVMDSKDPLLSHQYDLVKALAANFDQLTVITGHIGEIELPQNFRLISTNWRQGKTVRNIYRFISRGIPVTLLGRYDVVFFHMTDVQCAILAPVIRMRRKKQFLWYAHTFKSPYLTWASCWITKIITSTPGSCPIKGKKVIPIGQGISQSLFSPITYKAVNLDKLIHIGRFDKLKQIDLLINAAKKLKLNFPNLTFTQIGSPSNDESKKWALSLRDSWQDEIQDGWLKFKESIPRDSLPAVFAENGCFLHAYPGSLDKTLIEATMLKLPVVTLNFEYISIFGSWSSEFNSSLENEYSALRLLAPEDVEKELSRRLQIASNHHSFSGWIDRLTSVLKMGEIENNYENIVP